jgi:hypothetical protein
VAQLKQAYQRVNRALGDSAQQHLRVPGIQGWPSTSTSSKRLDHHQDSSLVFTFPEAEDDYTPITPRGYDNLPEEAKGEIRYLEYSNNRKPPSYHYINTEGNRVPCEFINGKWYTLHHYKDGYRTSKDLEFTAAELHINKLLELENMSSGGSLARTPLIMQSDLEPEEMAVESPIDSVMGLLSLWDYNEEINSTTIAMMQIAPTQGAGPSGGNPGGGGPLGGGGRGGGSPSASPGPQQQALPRANPPHGGSFKGTPLSYFNGNRTKYKQWWVELKLYLWINWSHPSIENPAEKALTTLSYIWGDQVTIGLTPN